MPQKNAQLQTMQQIQGLSPQQVLEAQLLELSTEELVQHIEIEMLDNEALEKGAGETEHDLEEDYTSEGQDAPENTEGVLRDSEDDYDSEERSTGSPMDVASWQIRNEESFHDLLMEQLGEMTLTNDQTIIMKYLIGSLDEDGWLRKDLQQIADEMCLYEGEQFTTEELEECLQLMQQQFEPAGIGGRDLKECLMLQIERRPQDKVKELLVGVLQEHYDLFCSNRWDKIAELLSLNEEEAQLVRKEMMRLNPHPGGGLHTNDLPNTIRPDFLLTVENDDIQVSLNNAIVPPLRVSKSYLATIDTAPQQNLSKKQADTLAYIRDKVKRAQSFINAIHTRHTMLLNTMRAIARRQKDYFLTGDETMLQPLTMREVAEAIHVDISTISRVCNSKFVDTPYGTHPLKDYFVERFAPRNHQNKEVHSVQKVKEKLKAIIDSENKEEPYSDKQLGELMNQAGFPIARRTVAKYREQLGLPNAILRKN